MIPLCWRYQVCKFGVVPQLMIGYLFICNKNIKASNSYENPKTRTMREIDIYKITRRYVVR